LEAGMINEQEIKATRGRIQKLLDEAVEFARQSPKVGPEDALKYVYAE
jgi:TPP-dependent pyruvate/acetoin dehydrogenase alpha subunit